MQNYKILGPRETGRGILIEMDAGYVSPTEKHNQTFLQESRDFKDYSKPFEFYAVLQKTVSKPKFDYYMSMMENGIDRFGIHEDSIYYRKSHVINTMYRLHQHSLYTISMQASIWNKNFFKSCLIKHGHENPWEFEVNGSTRLNSTQTHNILFDKQEEPWYNEAMRKGQFTQEYHDILKKENLHEI